LKLCPSPEAVWQTWANICHNKIMSSFAWMIVPSHSTKLASFTLQSTRLHSALVCGYNASNCLAPVGCAAQRRKQLAAYYRQASSASLTRKTLLDNVGTVQTLYGKETSPRSIFSIRKQLAAEAEWLQEEDVDAAVVGTQTLDSAKRPRFDWRQRAPSRIRAQLGDAAPPAPFVRRTRAVALPAAKQTPELAHAIENYSTRCVALVENTCMFLLCKDFAHLSHWRNWRMKQRLKNV